MGSLSIWVDQSVYYRIQDALRSAGFVNPETEEDLITVIDGDIVSFLQAQAEERGVDGAAAVEADDTYLPAVTIEEGSGLKESPAGLGGDMWEERAYVIGVHGTTPSMSKEIADVLRDALRYGLDVYNYDMGAPDASGFPLSGQYLGRFPVKDLSDRKTLALPTQSLIDSVRREIRFDILKMRNTKT